MICSLPDDLISYFNPLNGTKTDNISATAEALNRQVNKRSKRGFY